MTRYPVTAAVNNPRISGKRANCCKLSIFIIWREQAPNNAGMAMKKENLAALWCFIPIRSAKEIVMPEREIPGNKAKA